MAVSIGKRKRQGGQSDSEDEGAVRARFQQAFEARFKPLERSTSFSRHEESYEVDESDHFSDESDWDGLSENEGAVEVVGYDAAHSENQKQQNLERKAFMVCRRRKYFCMDMTDERCSPQDHPD